MGARASTTAGGGDSAFGALWPAAARELAAVSDSPSLDAQLLLAAAAGCARSAVLAYPERVLGAESVARFRALTARRARGEPLAYLTGTREFFGLGLEVGSAVLVPRPETELMVEEVLGDLRGGLRGARRVLDLATGSGAIALALKRAAPVLAVTGADVSPAALEIARANAARLGLEVEWLESDWFAALVGRRFDVIVCNPPYIASTDPHFAGPLRFEPRLALDGGPDGLDAVRVVLRGAPEHLTAGGRLLVEHGFEQRRDIVGLAAAAGLRVVAARSDLAGKDRYVVLAAP